jgi:hypothetical protein
VHLPLHVHTTHVFSSIGKQGHLPGLFESYAQDTLVLGARPGLAAWLDFSTIRDVPFYETVCIFVVDFAHMIVAELAYFAARCTLASSALAPFATRGSFRSSLHGLFSSILS